MPDAITLHAIEKKHVIRIGEELFRAFMPNEYSRARKDDLRRSDVLLAT